MTRPVSWSLCLLLLTLTTALAVFTGGADETGAFVSTIFALGLAGIAGSLVLFQTGPTSRPERVINVAGLFFVAYVAFQLVPLPIAFLRVISPTRAEIAEALSYLTGGARFAPLTVAPPTTWLQLSRITAYAIAFFVVRQLVRRSPFGPWTAALPLVAIGTGQAAYALLASNGETSLISGSYPNRNHFAGLIEMTLPFALMYGVSVLHRSGRRGVLAMSDVAKAALPFGATCLMLVAILFSSSKSGAAACLLSLFFMSGLSLGRGLPRPKRWGFLALLTLLLLVAFVFLTPTDLVERFGAAAADGTTEGRVPVWRDTLHLIAAFPLFGSGLGTFFPAFLRYQINGIGWAWTNTHNDYLQLLSELGLVGFIAPAVLMVAVCGRAVAVASDSELRESRFLGLACAGSLLAILIHSLTDFNTYVTANGLVLAWVSGVAATLGPAAAALEAHAGPRPVTVGRGVGPIVLLLGILVALYGGAWTLFLQKHQDDVADELRYCRFGVCDTDGVLAVLRNQARPAAPGQGRQVSPDVLLSYLDRDRSAPYRWDEIGDALYHAGRQDDARAAFAQAVTLGPTSASTLLRAAEFQFDDGQKQHGFELTSRALRVGDAQVYDAAFSMLAAKKISSSDLADAVGMNRAATLALLRRLLQPEYLDLAGARSVWSQAVGHGYVDDGVARDYTGALIQHKLDRAAWDDWVRYASRRNAAGYPRANRIFNGAFEREPSGAAFDWRIQLAAGVAATIVRDGGESGVGALRLTFDGTQNVGDVGVEQWVYLEPGHYALRAHMRSDSLSTDQGIGFRISGGQAPTAFIAVTDTIRGTSNWTTLEADFDAPVNGGLTSVTLVRTPSLKFDKLLRGQLWITSVQIISCNPTP